MILSPAANHPNQSSRVVSLERVKQALRLPADLTDEDDYLSLLVDSAEEYIEALCGMSIRTRSHTLKLSLFPGSRIPINKFPFNTMTSLVLDGTPSTAYYIEPSLTGNSYLIYDDYVTFNQSLSPEKYSKPDNIVATFTLGFSTVPNSLILTILNLVGWAYQNRELFPRANLNVSNFALHPYILIHNTNFYG